MCAGSAVPKSSSLAIRAPLPPAAGRHRPTGDSFLLSGAQRSAGSPLARAVCQTALTQINN